MIVSLCTWKWLKFVAHRNTEILIPTVLNTHGTFMFNQPCSVRGNVCFNYYPAGNTEWQNREFYNWKCFEWFS